MATYNINYTIETENEVSQSALEMARDQGGEEIEQSIETSGGGTTTADGVIEGGRRPGASKADKEKDKKG